MYPLRVALGGFCFFFAAGSLFDRPAQLHKSIENIKTNQKGRAGAAAFSSQAVRCQRADLKKKSLRLNKGKQLDPPSMVAGAPCKELGHPSSAMGAIAPAIVWWLGVRSEIFLGWADRF